MGEEQKRWQTVWQNLQTYKSPLATGPGILLAWNPPSRYQIFVWKFLTHLKLEWNGENTQFLLSFCWNMKYEIWKWNTKEHRYKSVLAIVLTQYAIPPAVLGDHWYLEKKTGWILGTKLSSSWKRGWKLHSLYETIELHTSRRIYTGVEYIVHWGVWHVDTDSKSWNCYFPAETAVVYPASELAARRNCPSCRILRPFQPKIIITVLNLGQIMMLILMKILLQNCGSKVKAY